MTAEEAIEKYATAYRKRADKKYAIQFKVENDFIRIGYVDLNDNWIQWGMQRYTPELLAKMAHMMSLGLEHGDPKKPMAFVAK